jgi:hypothetical protein
MTRERYGIFLVAAGVAIGLASVGLVAVLAFGGWPASLYGPIVDILGRTLMGAGGLLALTIVFLGIGGPVKRTKLGGKLFNLEAEGDE